MHYEPNDHVIGRGHYAVRNRRDNVRLAQTHRCASEPNDASRDRAIANIRCSPKCGASSCPPTGSPATRPIGRDSAGMPARLAVTVKMSLRYISYGSDLDPAANAVVGVVGVNSTSTPEENVFSKSRPIAARAAIAFM